MKPTKQRGLLNVANVRGASATNGATIDLSMDGDNIEDFSETDEEHRFEELSQSENQGETFRKAAEAIEEKPIIIQGRLINK